MTAVLLTRTSQSARVCAGRESSRRPIRHIATNKPTKQVTADTLPRSGR